MTPFELAGFHGSGVARYLYAKGNRVDDPAFSLALSHAHGLLDRSDTARLLVLGELPEAQLDDLKQQIRQRYPSTMHRVRYDGRTYLVSRTAAHAPDSPDRQFEWTVLNHYAGLRGITLRP